MMLRLNRMTTARNKDGKVKEGLVLAVLGCLNTIRISLKFGIIFIWNRRADSDLKPVQVEAVSMPEAL